MFIMLTMAAATAQPLTLAQSSLPPPITVVPAPSPTFRTASRSGDAYAMAPTPVASMPLRVRVVAGTQVLFNDTLRITRNASASYQESRSEAPNMVCGERDYSSQERYSLNINLYSRDDSSNGPAVNVSVSWTRPSQMIGCSGEGTRQVQLIQTVPLAPGQSVTLQGDAGLTVTLSR